MTTGTVVMLVGILCPMFWIALFTKAKAKELKLHAIHSGIVVLIGLVLVIMGL